MNLYYPRISTRHSSKTAEKLTGELTKNTEISDFPDWGLLTSKVYYFDSKGPSFLQMKIFSYRKNHNQVYSFNCLDSFI